MGADADGAAAAAQPAGAHAAEHHARAKYVRILLAVGLGIILEWYDFVVFSNLSAVITKSFFPPGDAATEALLFWGVFAMGFVARPVGSILFGHIGDVHGRKPCLVATVSIMGVATVLIGCLPTYHMIGIAAPVLLALLRIVQGLAMGGEFGCSLVYLHEVAPARRKGLSGALGFAAAIGGIAFGVALVMIMTAACSAAQLALWGWRVPFLLAFVTASAAMLMRLHMEEPEEWRAAKRREAEDALRSASPTPRSSSGAGKADAALPGPAAAAPPRLARLRAAPFVALVSGHWWSLLLQFLFEASVSVSFWLCTSYLPSFFQSKVGLAPELSLGMLLANLGAMVPAIVGAGWLADRPGFPRVAWAVGAYVLSGAMCVPMFLAWEITKSVAACWLLMLAYMLLLSAVLGVLPVSMSCLYPPTQRASGFNFAHNCAMSLMGGLAPTVVTAISVTTSNTVTAPGWYMLAVTLVSILAGAAIIFVAPEANRDRKAGGADADMAVDMA
ncbi:MAG: major facilitator superfamily domain-containing protein [Monoraphidium minutum]|nr:MAG: major facilitator superfamily domain-containing protein [Monoraphidium minutum]